MRLLHHQVVATALSLVLSIQTAYTSNLYAFYTDKGVHIAAQDPNTGEALYSNCNSSGIPVFPIETPNVLPTFSKPRNGTALTAAGWWDGNRISNEDGDIANCFYKCDMETGRFNRTSESYPALIARVGSVHEQTGLSVELSGVKDEYRMYRLFYHNAQSQVMMMSWRQDTKLWTDAGMVSPEADLGLALQSAQYEGKNVSVAFPRGSRDMEVAHLEGDDLWQLESFPRPLSGKATNETEPDQIKVKESAIPKFSFPSWNPATQAIGHSVGKSGLGVSAGVFAVGALIWFLVHHHYAPASGSQRPGTRIEGGSHSDLPELYIVQRATPIVVQSTEPSVGKRPAELEQPVAVYELVGH